MSAGRRIAWFALSLLLAFLASLPLWLHLPEPKSALAIGTASCVSGCEETSPVRLPLSWRERGGQAEYRVEFSLEQRPSQPLYVFIPVLKQRAGIWLAGRQIADSGTQALMTGVTSGSTMLAPLPADDLLEGVNALHITLQAAGLTWGYLSKVYVGTADQLAPYYRLRTFLLEHLRLMVLAAQLLACVAVLVTWIYRPRDELFGWMSLLLVVSLLSYASLLADLLPRVSSLLPYALMLNTATGFILMIIALLVNGSRPPPWLKACAAAVPGACVLLALSGMASPYAIVLAIGTPILVLAPLATLAISAWGALAGKVKEAWLLLVPLALLCMATLHDGAVAAMWLDGPVYIAFYYRQAIIIAIAVILARRLGISLLRLDGANAHLKQRLAQREQELARLHEEERHETMQRVRSEERQRLTADLHDGLSGHLASIIALAEREHSPFIESSARDALDDLRAVIHSLDIGDRELAAALSGLRERLERQLKRMGIALDWSTAHLPEISGVTPTHALNVLRIVQEAITNAAKHGPAAHIRVSGKAGLLGQAVIVIDNDGEPFLRGCGSGLRNMRRRAIQLAARCASKPWRTAPG